MTAWRRYALLGAIGALAWTAVLEIALRPAGFLWPLGTGTAILAAVLGLVLALALGERRISILTAGWGAGIIAVWSLLGLMSVGLALVPVSGLALAAIAILCHRLGGSAAALLGFTAVALGMLSGAGGYAARVETGADACAGIPNGTVAITWFDGEHHFQCSDGAVVHSAVVSCSGRPDGPYHLTGFAGREYVLCRSGQAVGGGGGR
ncbi:MAG: hypothetical protein ACYDAY_06190 [Candidatus Dormibacteria bacterium]